MNKELIKKYKAEFDYWLNGGKLLFQYLSNSTDTPIEDYWIEDNTPFMSNTLDVVIVINDEYVEFRKALAEGKTVQYTDSNGETKSLDAWDNICWKQFKGCVNNYRIKPDEPKFKVGDWITYEDDYGQIIAVRSDRYETQWTKRKSCDWIDRNCYTLWTPTEGELACWYNYFRKDNTIYQVGYVTKEVLDSYDHIVPIEFIQTLKDK